jgi:hypothetical protein
MKTAFENLENGNLSDAKRLARRYSVFRLATYAQLRLGWSCRKALAAACYLKGENTFQAYCDAK